MGTGIGLTSDSPRIISNSKLLRKASKLLLTKRMPKILGVGLQPR